MDFCKLCENMLYVRFDRDTNILENYCKNCNFSEEVKSNESIAIIENNYENDDNNKVIEDGDDDNTFNINIKYDPTLPRVNNIICPNKKCTKKNTDDNEVIYTKYYKVNMRYRYYCIHCDHFWKN